jgi:predicted DCC family thiol-disulfide oxidoreductase YuxK
MTTTALPENVRPQDAVLLYDGLCGFCDGTVRWFLRHKAEQDGSGQLYFTPQQSELAQALIARHGLDLSTSYSVYLLIHPGTDRERILQRSAAILHAVAMLGDAWTALASLASVLPRSLCDAVYKLIARTRYRFAKRLTACRLPMPEERSRFLGLTEN